MKHSNKIKTVLVTLLLACSGAACAQDYEEVAEVDYQDVIYVDEENIFEEEEIFDTVEEQPSFVGGQAALVEYLGSNIIYPEISRHNGSQGTAYVRFTVNADGSIQDVEILRSSGDIYLDKEALRVVGGMPKWNPGRQLDKPVRVKYVLPVKFRLS